VFSSPHIDCRVFPLSSASIALTGVSFAANYALCSWQQLLSAAWVAVY